MSSDDLLEAGNPPFILASNSVNNCIELEISKNSDTRKKLKMPALCLA